ncbi:nuclear transport factor 2 family protein [Diaminobutyricibacter tongyongensis]|uniref:Nuclear transport factor 2 family protein n=1 Tax=Leifsonia tongyongensis TaxID=1268043 RepID=A0A6L9XVQ0_9MICO|nr:nuclear transport factor 2 family protein [Diaminobutyricibacter tongyongensis]NEN05511.1 nuclear transport factor 2 family protein [Diaminobutyricibacter tongyongensis]
MSDAIATWIDGYRRAWESNDPDDIRALFTEDASYRTEPFADPWVGHLEIVEGWLDAQDEPGAADFEWRALGRDGSLVFVEGVTEYHAGPTYSNLWVIRLEPDGRASEFTEWWMDQTDSSDVSDSEEE